MLSKFKTIFTLLLFVYGSAFSNDELTIKNNIIKAGKDTVELIKLYSDLGELYFKNSLFVDAQEQFMMSLKFAQEKEMKFNVGTNFNNLSSTYYQSEKYDLAKKYALKAIEIFDELNQVDYLINSYNSLANAHYMLYEDSLAIVFYTKAIEMAKETNHENLAVFYKNFGGVLFETKDTINGIKHLKKSLKLDQIKNDTYLKFSNLTALAEIYSYSNQNDSALVYYQNAEQYIDSIKFNNRLKDFYYGYSYYYSNIGDYQKALNAYKLYQSYKDSTINEFNSKSINELETKYRVKEIEQEKELAKTLAVNEKQKNELYLVVIVSVILLSIIIILAIYLYNKRKKAESETRNQKLKTQAIIEAEEKERARTAKDLHDGIVQDLTVLKLNMNQLIEELPTEIGSKVSKISESLSTTANEVRGISYQMMPITLQEHGLVKALEELLQRNLTARSISFDFDHFESSIRLNKSIETSVYRITQELINNVVKHSGANHISVILQLKNNFLSLIFEDNGKGFDYNSTQKGIGLNSLNSRIEMAEGTIQIDSSENAGTTAFIRIPIK